jgi:F-type H+-transporting ATPase subunit gamma
MSLIDIKKTLIAMRTLERATGAIKTLSMSFQNDLKKVCEKYDLFCEELNRVKDCLVKPFKKKLLSDHREISLVIFIGGAKGLCGNYNNEMRRAVHDFFLQDGLEDFYLIVGKKFIEITKKEFNENLDKVFKFEEFDKKNVLGLCDYIVNLIKIKKIKIIKFVYLQSKSIFNRKPISSFFEFGFKEEHINRNLFFGAYENKKQIIEIFSEKFIRANILKILYQALLSENSSRFIAMDSANKNAQKIIHDKQIYYNKKRQSSITNGLLDTIGSLIAV